MSEDDLPASPGPYKGLASFEDSELDASLFFGRDAECEVITANLQASRLTVLYGPSGCGKSSVLRAGVAHGLRRQAEANLEDGRRAEHAVVVFDRWSDDPADGIAAAVADAIAPLAGALPEDNGAVALSERVGAWVEHLGGELYLVLDQAEEYFLYRPPDGQDEFARALPELVGRPDLPVNVIVSLREDALGRLDMFRAGIPSLFANTLRLALLDETSARDAVVGPLGRYADLAGADGPAEIETELVEAVLADTRAGEIELAGAAAGQGPGTGEGIETAFLQLVLQRLWETERRAGSSTLRLDTFRQLGGAEQIVQDHLGAALATFTPEQQDAAAAAFNHLVTPSGTKVAHGITDLATYSNVEPAFLAPVLASLAEQRILRPLPPADGSSDLRYEIFHDVLAGPILGWRTEHETERRLAGERREARHRHRRLLAVTIASLVGLAIAVGLAIFALAQRSEAQEQEDIARASLGQAQESEAEAREAEAEAEESAAEASEAQQRAEDQTEAAENQARISRARQLAALATTQLAVDPELSLLLSLEAVNVDPLPEAAEALRQSLLLSRVRLELRAEDDVNEAWYSPNGRLIVTASDDGVARVYDKETGDLVNSLDHGEPVNAVAFSPDGRLVASAGDDGTARIWPARSSNPEQEQIELPHDGRVTSLSFAPDGSRLATGSRDTAARLWDVETGNLVHELSHPRAVTLVAFDPSSTELATAAEDFRVRVWSTSGAQIGELPHRARVTSISWQSDGAFLATTSNDRTAKLWLPGVWTGQTLRGPRGPFFSSEFSPDGTLLATGSSDAAGRLWLVELPRRPRILTGHLGHVIDVSFDSSGRWLVTASRDRTARVWRVGATTLLTVLAGHTDDVVSAVFSPDAGEVLTAGADGTARVWSSSVAPDLKELVNHGERVATASFSPDGSLAVSAGEDGTARIVRTDGIGEEIVLQHQDAVTSATFSAGGQTVLTGSLDGSVRLWRTDDGGLLETLEAGSPLTSAALSPDGTLVAGGSDDGRLQVWRLESHELVAEARHQGPVNRVAFSPDGVLLVSAGGDNRARIVDTRTGEVVTTLRGHGAPIVDAGFSPDGSLVATASVDDTARVWDPITGEELHVLGEHERDATSVSFSPDGRKVLTTSRDGDGRTWDAATGEPLRILRGHLSLVSDASFSPDGTWIVTAGPIAAAVWNAETGRPLIFPLTGHRRRVTSASFSADGRHILTSSYDGTVRIYDCEVCGALDEIVAVAEARLDRTGRELTPEERELYLGD